MVSASGGGGDGGEERFVGEVAARPGTGTVWLA